jgi:hypothetical protein
MSNLNLRKKRTILNRISNLARVKLTHTLGTSKDRYEATVCLSFRVVEQATTSDCRTVRTPIVQDIRL